MIDLSPFCSSDPFRPYLHSPFSRGAWTYATNGHILARVPRRPDIAEIEKAPNPTKVFELAGAATPGTITTAPLPSYDLPGELEAACDECEGRGTEHECPDCDCQCEACGGSGKMLAKISVDVGGVPCSAFYVSLLATLPGIHVATAPIPKTAVYFQFEGGDGLLVPLNSQCSTHVEPKNAR